MAGVWMIRFNCLIINVAVLAIVKHNIFWLYSMSNYLIPLFWC